MTALPIAAAGAIIALIVGKWWVSGLSIILTVACWIYDKRRDLV